MSLKRAAALPLLAFALGGCHEDPEVVTIFVTPTSIGFSITTCGGSGTASASVAGTGGTGGAINVFSWETLQVGASTLAPTAPTPPAAPTAGTAVVSLAAFPATAGNLLIPGGLVTDAVAAQTVESTTGDIVVSGSIQCADNGGSQTNLTLRALNGTVYISGVVRTASVDGVLDSNDAGNLTIDAARIVITGTIDARGEASSAGPGGDGGTVTIATSAGGDHIYFTSGSIDTSGGTGTTGGGTGGAVTLTAGNQLHGYGSITTSGGAVSGTGMAGAGGNVTVNGGGGVDLVSVVTMRGGSVTGTGAGANGGAGGIFTTDSYVPTRLYATIDAQGGAATVPSLTAGTLTGGTGGAVNIGQGTGTLTLEIGRGPMSSCGGAGGVTSGIGGAITLNSDNGNITVGLALDSSGGSGSGTGPATGGLGGAVSVATAAGYDVQSLTLLSTASILTSGGASVGAAAAGNAGTASLSCGIDLTVLGTITARGGDSAGAAGNGAGVTLSSDSGGDIILSAAIQASGGTSTGAAGGNGGSVALNNTGSPGEIISSTTIAAAGGTGLGAGGTSGTIGLTTANGDITLSGTLTTAGASSATTPQAGGAITVTCGGGGGSITSSAAINASGGGSTAISGTNLAGADGGAVGFVVGHSTGALSLLSTSSIVTNGGNSTGSPGVAGTGGIVSLSTLDQLISISGSIVALGGNALDTGGAGGLGGRVLAQSDAGGVGGLGGDITLESGASINVSGGTGTTGGSARSNPIVATITLGAATIAVHFDADGDLTTTPSADSATSGRVVNNGTIIANSGGTPGAGGDVYFDGRTAAGADLTALDGGSQSRLGALPGTDGDFVGD